MKVTGPDGDNPITDEQIREERRYQRGEGNQINVEICDTALGQLRGVRGQVVDFALGEIRQARELCAATWNARHGVTP